jgi:hypothetical protein
LGAWQSCWRALFCLSCSNSLDVTVVTLVTHNHFCILTPKLLAVNKSIKRAIALMVMIAALSAIYVGIGYISNYEGKDTIRTLYTRQSIIVPPRGYGCIRIDINETGDHDIRSTINGTLRTDGLTESDCPAWANGSYEPLYSTEIGPSINNSRSEETYLLAYSTMPWYSIYWNTNASASVEVRTEVFRVTTNTAYNYSNLGLGSLLVGVGAVSGLAAAFSISRRVLMVIVALVLIASGAMLLITYNQKFTHDEAVSSKTILVPANSNKTEPIHYNTTDPYALLCTIDRGSISSTTMSEEDYTDYIQGQHDAYWQTWRFEHTLGGENCVCDLTHGGYKYGSEAYLLLLNSDAYDKVVTVQFERYWESYNYLGLVGGVLALAGGASLLLFANRRQLTAFNQALDKE